MNARAERISKSRYVVGRQCLKRLWWTTHEAEAPELVPNAELRARLDVGHQLGELARTYVPGGLLIDLPPDDPEARAAATRDAIASGAQVIYEAAFFADDAFVAVDILERSVAGFVMVEVKASTSVKLQHLADLAFQVHVARRAGLDVVRAEVMHVDSRCTAPDLSNLFTRVDVTALIEPLLVEVPGEIHRQLASLRHPLPLIEVGDHCRAPYPCHFLSRCSTSALPRRLPPAVLDRKERAERDGTVVVEPTLDAALEPFVPPIAFLDFETIATAVPRWHGTHPYEAVPVQFSVHALSSIEASARHHEHLASRGDDDPRPALARALVEACRGAEVVAAYNASFERTVIERLAVAVPSLERELVQLAARTLDLLVVVREHVYHPGFRGRFGLKPVTAALCPGIYDDLPIVDGGTATRALERLLLAPVPMPDEERSALERSLLAYCEADTRATMALWRTLRALSSRR